MPWRRMLPVQAERLLFLRNTPSYSRAPLGLSSGRLMLDAGTLRALREPLFLYVERLPLLVEPPEESSAPPDLSANPP